MTDLTALAFAAILWTHPGAAPCSAADGAGCWTEEHVPAEVIAARPRMAPSEALGVPLSALEPSDLRGGARLSEVGEDGRVLVEMSIRLPAHIAQTVWEIVERHRR